VSAGQRVAAAAVTGLALSCASANSGSSRQMSVKPDKTGLVIEVVMILTMAYEVTRSGEFTLVLETQVAVTPRGNDRCVEINQVRVIR
jgi:uncharacterized cupredoxin-like copper-binding protein